MYQLMTDLLPLRFHLQVQPKISNLKSEISNSPGSKVQDADNKNKNLNWDKLMQLFSNPVQIQYRKQFQYQLTAGWFSTVAVLSGNLKKIIFLCIIKNNVTVFYLYWANLNTYRTTRTSSLPVLFDEITT